MYRFSNSNLRRKSIYDCIGCYTQIEPICDSQKGDIQQCNNSLTPISILGVTDSSNRDLNELDQSFMYSQLLKEIFLELKYETDLKKELVNFCRIQYHGHTTELKIIDEFEEHYGHHSPIWWYTRECFTYSMLNKAPRTQDIAIVIKMGFIIRDIHRQVSLLFAKKAQQNLDLTAILFRMEINPALSSSPFAPLNNISYYSDSEKEVLFSIHTVFRIGEIEQIENGLWQVELILTSDNDGGS
jgi:hypothetical protein